MSLLSQSIDVLTYNTICVYITSVLCWSDLRQWCMMHSSMLALIVARYLRAMQAMYVYTLDHHTSLHAHVFAGTNCYRLLNMYSITSISVIRIFQIAIHPQAIKYPILYCQYTKYVMYIELA